MWISGNGLSNVADEDWIGYGLLLVCVLGLAASAAALTASVSLNWMADKARAQTIETGQGRPNRYPADGVSAPAWDGSRPFALAMSSPRAEQPSGSGVNLPKE